MPGAAERVAAKLAEKKAANAAAPAAASIAEADEDVEPGSENIDTPEDFAEEAPMSLADRAKAARAAKANGKPVAPSVAETVPKVAKAKAGSNGTGAGKKAPSPAQLAAREAFAARSRAKAAERAGTADPVTEVIEKSVNKTGKVRTPAQTPEQIKAKQNADRKAERDKIAATEAARPVRVATSKPKAAKETTAQAKARVAKEKAEAARVAKVSGAKKAKPVAAKGKATTDRAPIGDTKAKVHALIAKGQTRRQIAEALDLSYAAVMYHAKSAVGAVPAARGSIFVDTELGANGRKLRNGKTENVSRSEAMRRMYRSGDPVGDVARAFNVRYQIAYTAIRPILGEEEVEE